MLNQKIFFGIFIVFGFSLPGIAQQSTSVFPTNNIDFLMDTDTTSMIHVDSILIIGNRKTKDYIILRELKIKKGDSITAVILKRLIKETRELIYNTNLFAEVDIEPSFISPSKVFIRINVKERWYIYPNPIFSLTDRNINEWWNVYNADLGRINYGIKFTHYNFTGRADQLRLNMLNGYNRNIFLEYNNPNISKDLNKGLSIGVNYIQNKEFPFKTSFDNQLVQFRKDNYARESLSVLGVYKIRKGYYRRHSFSLQYTYIRVNDSVVNSKYNSAYFNSTSPSVSFIDFGYGFQYVNVNNINYPLKGEIFSTHITKRGLGISGGINMLMLDVSYRKFIPLPKKYYFSLQGFSKIKLPFNQPYINQRAMGYGNYYLRGLENYVIDGVFLFLTKVTFTKKIFSVKIPVPFRFNAIPNIPIALYAKTYTDGGYAHTNIETRSKLNNKLLYTSGLGVDIVSLYDITTSLEYSFNQLGQKGLFLHFRSSF
ncbi:MAG: hypothetical protein FGM46_05460 [Ferruginibacter sp.]|nr:hypothetical protein [Ferruginibacter sp.]